MPVATAVTSPPGEVTVAMLVAELVQPTEDPEMLFELPSEYLAVQVNCVWSPTASVTAEGLMKIELIEGSIKKPLQPHQVMQRREAKPAVSTNRLWLTSRTILAAEAIRQRIVATAGDLFSVRFISTLNINTTLTTELSR